MYYVWYKLPNAKWSFYLFDGKKNQLHFVKSIQLMCSHYALGEGPAVNKGTHCFQQIPPKTVKIRKGRAHKKENKNA